MIEILKKIENINIVEEQEIYKLIDDKVKLLYLTSKIYNNIQELINMQGFESDPNYSDFILEYKAEIVYYIIIALKELNVKPSNLFKINYGFDNTNIYSLLNYPTSVFEGYKTNKSNSYINDLMAILKNIVNRKNIYNIYKYLKKGR